MLPSILFFFTMKGFPGTRFTPTAIVNTAEAEEGVYAIVVTVVTAVTWDWHGRQGETAGLDAGTLRVRTGTSCARSAVYDSTEHTAKQ